MSNGPGKNFNLKLLLEDPDVFDAVDRFVNIARTLQCEIELRHNRKYPHTPPDILPKHVIQFLGFCVGLKDDEVVEWWNVLKNIVWLHEDGHTSRRGLTEEEKTILQVHAGNEDNNLSLSTYRILFLWLLVRLIISFRSAYVLSAVPVLSNMRKSIERASPS